MRSASPNDFSIDVEKAGRFVVARRTMRDEFKIATEFSRLTEGVETPTRFLSYYARSFACAKVLIVSAPDGFDLDAMDPLNDDSYAALISFYETLAAKEDDFRSKPGKPGEAGSKAAS